MQTRTHVTSPSLNKRNILSLALVEQMITLKMTKRTFLNKIQALIIQISMESKAKLR